MEGVKVELNIRDKIAVVTGASEGIGRAIAMGLAREGAKVGISGRRKSELERAAEEIKSSTGNDNVLTVMGDMSVRAEARRFIGEVLNRWGTVHILVNNVGRATLSFFNDLSMEDWKNALQTNLYSTIHCTEATLSHMRAQRWGRIINISSISGKEPGLGLIASNVAKSGVISFSKALALEVAKEGILVNCVCPGRILSAQTVRLHTAEERERIAFAHIPVGRFGEPEEVANLVVFLASERASYITGTTMLVDGGMARGLF
jgi:3-oxoacyl-[acyl-carrier protein] reductase